MASKVLHGKHGSVSFTHATVAITEGITAWTLEVVGDTTGGIATMDQDYEIHYPTYKSWTATVTTVDAGDANFTEALLFGALAKTGEDTATLTLTEADGYDAPTDYAYSGSAYLAAVNKSLDMNGVVNITFNFQGTGALAVA